MLTDAQTRVHAIPAVVHRALLAPARATAGIGRLRTRDLDERGHGNIRHREHRLALREADVVIHDIAGTQHHRHAEPARGFQRLVQARHDRIDTHGRGFAPVIVPDIHRDHTHPHRIDLLRREHDPTGIRIAGLQGQRDLGTGRSTDRSQGEEQ